MIASIAVAMYINKQLSAQDRRQEGAKHPQAFGISVYSIRHELVLLFWIEDK